jgi:hypothetical protein
MIRALDLRLQKKCDTKNPFGGIKTVFVSDFYPRRTKTNKWQFQIDNFIECKEQLRVGPDEDDYIDIFMKIRTIIMNSHEEDEEPVVPFIDFGFFTHVLSGRKQTKEILHRLGISASRIDELNWKKIGEMPEPRYIMASSGEIIDDENKSVFPAAVGVSVRFTKSIKSENDKEIVVPVGAVGTIVHIKPHGQDGPLEYRGASFMISRPTDGACVTVRVDGIDYKIKGVKQQKGITKFVETNVCGFTWPFISFIYTNPTKLVGITSKHAILVDFKGFNPTHLGHLSKVYQAMTRVTSWTNLYIENFGVNPDRLY